MYTRKLSSANIFSRFWIYQAERFPILGHGVLIAAFSFSAVCFSTMLRGRVKWPAPGTILVAFVSAFLFFLLLRLADEFKDAAEDARYRPYRPVPRGLVTLTELGGLAILSMLVQLGLAWWLEPALLPLLFLAWGYLALMSKEFFVRSWLKAHPLAYLATHMVIVPLIDLYTTACDWSVAATGAPHGLTWFLIASFFNGVVIEIGRKIRSPQNEEVGVETYTALWGRGRAILVWLGALTLTMFSALLAAHQIGFMLPVAGLLAGFLSLAAMSALRFLSTPTTARAKLIEILSGVWTILMYLSVGVLPLLWQMIGG